MNKSVSILTCMSIICIMMLHADPAQYALFTSNVQSAEMMEFLSHIKLRGDEKIVDFGCRSGKFTLWCAPQLPKGKILAVDHDPAMLTYLQTQLKEQNLRNCICTNNSQAGLGFYKNQFDIIGSFSYLHWIGDYESTFKIMHQMLKPGGKLLMRIGVSDELERKIPFLCHVETIAQRSHWKGYFANMQSTWYHPLDVETGKKLLEATGFKLIRIAYTYRTATFPSTQDLAQWILTWDPHAAYLPSHLALSYALQIAERFDATCLHDTEGNIILERPALEIEAQKI